MVVLLTVVGHRLLDPIERQWCCDYSRSKHAGLYLKPGHTQDRVHCIIAAILAVALPLPS